MPTLVPTYPPLPPQPPPPPPPPTSLLPQIPNPSTNKQIPSLIQQNNSENSQSQVKIMPLLNLSPPSPAPSSLPLISNSQQQPKSLLDLDQIKPHQRNNVYF